MIKEGRKGGSKEGKDVLPVEVAFPSSTVKIIFNGIDKRRSS